jgi:hypothetical protein
LQAGVMTQFSWIDFIQTDTFIWVAGWRENE